MRKNLFILILLAFIRCWGSGGSALAQTVDITEGGTATSNGDVSGGEDVTKAFDNTTATKFNSNHSLPLTVQYDFAGNNAYAVNSYTVSSANDAPARDPRDWQFQGSNDGTNWTTLDTRSNVNFGNRLETQPFTFSNATNYQLYRLYITANHNDGWTQLSELQMFATVSNIPPTVSITSPADGASFSAPSSITINATAADADGSVTQVQFYQGTTLLGTDNTSPYSYDWTGVASGTYSLTAKATDNGGLVTTSSAINITVSSGTLQDLTEGGTATSNGDIAGGEDVTKAFDNTTSTKFNSYYPLPLTVQYDFAGTTAYAVSSYTVSSANDAPARDPRDWQFQGSNDGSNWTTLDTRSNVNFTNRLETQTFIVSSPVSFQMYRLNITANHNDGWTQLSEIQMFGGNTPTPPPAPTGLTASAGNTQITLNWTASAGATSYNVYRGTTAGGESTTAIATGITSTSYTNTGLTNGTAYYYKITAVNSNGTSAYSNEASSTPVSAIPSTPAGLTAGAGNTQITLSWTASAGAVSYNVYRGTAAGSESSTAIATGITSTGYTNTGLVNGTAYYYKVAAVNASGISALSNEASATPVLVISNNLALNKTTTVSSLESASYPGNLAVDGNATTRWASAYVDPSWIYIDLGSNQSVSRVVLNWEPAYGKTYMIQTSNDATNWSTNYSTTTSDGGIDDISFNTVNARYVRMYGVQRATSWCYSLWEFEVYGAGTGSVPSAPTGLTGVGGNAQVTLNWTASPGATSYSIYRGSASGNETIIASGIPSTNFVNTDLDNGVTYYYKVTAEVSSGNAVITSNYSNEVSALTVATIPPAPSALSPEAGNAQIYLTWNKSAGATSYSIYRGTSSNGESGTAIASGITDLNYLDLGLTNGTTYYYKVKATNVVGTSGYSNEASAAPSTNVTYYTFACAWMNQNQDGYLYDNGTNIYYTYNGNSDNFRWAIERVAGGYMRIKNKGTGDYMNIASGELNVKCTNISASDVTSHWKIAPVAGNVNLSIQNRSNGKYLNTETRIGYVTCEMTSIPSGDNLWSGQWVQTFDSGTGVPATGVSITPTTPRPIIVNGFGSYQLSANVVPSGATNKNVTWTTSNASVASISPTGNIIANGVGTATITVATQDGGFTDNCSVTVNSVAITGISLSPTSATINASTTKQFTATMAPIAATNKVVNWSSSNNAVATVSSFGVVKGIAAGNAVITATTQDGSRTATCSVNVQSVTGVAAFAANDFLNSISVCTHIAQGADNPTQVATALAYTGIRNFRDDFSTTRTQDWINIHNQTGARMSLLTASGNVSLSLSVAEPLAQAGALLAVEGPNEPNNFGVTYEGITSGYSTTFLPVARFQRDLYAAVKADPLLNGVAVFNSSEAGGSEPNNVGLQFNTIPVGAGTILAAGTQYADYANVHNYICRQPEPIDNMPWLNAETEAVSWVDGIYVEYGSTWHMGFQGYASADRATMPRVTTETGWNSSPDGAGTTITYEQQGRLYMNMYLSQFKRGFSQTFMYMLKDDPNQDIGAAWGYYANDWTPKLVAQYMHNFTTILADNNSINPGSVNYSIPSQPATTHDLLLQKSNGNYEVVVWSERIAGSDNVTVNLGSTFGTVKVYDPTTGTAAVQTLSNVSSVALTMSDHPMIIEFNPSGIKSAANSALDMLQPDQDGKDMLTVSYLNDHSVNLNVSSNDAYTIKVICINGRVAKTIKGNYSAIYNLTREELQGEGVYIINYVSQNTVTSKKIVLH